jgi:serine/threonine protein kinase/tetratricopeptide (TPR) repeat protein
MANPYRPSPADWARIDTIFTQALDLDPERWPAFLEEACGEDVEVRTRVTDLLRRSQTVDDFLEESCLEVQPELAGELAHRLESRDTPFPTEARIGAYRIIDTLGRGGAGTVYLAERAEGEERPPVALKVLRRGLDTDDLLERFTVERQILATLDHPDVARLLDAGATEDGRPYLVMEHVDGVPITEHCGARGLSVQERLGLFARVARAVHHAHGSLIVHRDLKPTNVLVAEDGAPKLLDFGIAKLLDPDALAGKGPQTRTGTRLLTPGYASPEQRRGEPVTPASDIYQLGLLLYELLTGVAAYEAAGKEREEAGEAREGRRSPLPRIPAPSKVARPTGETNPGKGTGGETDPATEAPPDTGSTTQRRRRRDLDRIVMTALEEEPEDRYPTAAALAADVERVPKGQRPQGVAHLPMGLAARKLARRLGTRRQRVAAATLALSAVAGILAVASVWSRDPGDGEPPAPDPGDPMFHLVPPPWVLVASFDGPADEPELGWAVRELVMEALNQTEGVAPVPPSELGATLRMAGLPSTAHMHTLLARQLAYRNGFPVALTGRVFRLGSGYGLRANAFKPEDGSLLTSALDRSPDQDGLTAAVERLVALITHQLREHLGTGAQIRPAILLTTPSFEAYEHYRRYLRAEREGRPAAEAYAELQRALDLDPEFAMAWRALAVWHHDGSRTGLAQSAVNRAMGLQDGVTELERLHIEAADKIIRGDFLELNRAVDLYGQILSQNPRDETAHALRLAALQHLTRYEEALKHYDALDALFPNGESMKGVQGRFQTLMSLGRLEEARALESKLSRTTWHEAEMQMALATGEWAVAESLALSLWNDPEGRGPFVPGVRWTLASARAARGGIRAADSTLQAFPSSDNGRARLVLALATGCQLALGRALPRAEDAAGNWPIWNAIVATAIGHQYLAADLRQNPSGCIHMRTQFSAMEEASNGNWRALTRPPFSLHAQLGVPCGYGSTALRWLVADAYERLGQPDSAAVYFHMVTDSANFFWREHYLRGFAYPFAQRRLAFLYSELGDRRRAEHHWNLFTTTFTDPDPELLWLLEESPWEGTLSADRSGDRDQADGLLFSDTDRTCASIEAGRVASFEGALLSTGQWFEEYFAGHGHYTTDGFPGLPEEVARRGHLLTLVEGDETSWTATAVDLRDTRVCCLTGGEPTPGGHRINDVMCRQRTYPEAYQEDRARVAIGATLSRLSWMLRAPWQTHDLFPPDLLDRFGQRQRPRPGEFFIGQQHPDVRIEVLHADADEFRALVTHVGSPARCILRVTNTLEVFLGC